MRTFLKRKVTDFNIFFCFLTNTVFLKKQFLWDKYQFSQGCFYSLYSLKTENNFLIKFLNHPADFWRLFWKIFSFNWELSSGFFVELELIGLGFRIRKIISTVYKFFWGYANFIYLFVPKDILVEYSADDRTIFFFGISALVVNDFSSYLMLLKKLSTYRVAGFIKPGKIIRLNSGKQR